MSQTILIIIGAIIILLLLSRKSREQVIGICAAAIGLDAKKRENKEKILTLLAEAGEKSLPLRGLPLKKGELANSDIREALGISERSVVRYLDELEREGKVEQVGSTGRGVTYRLKQ